MTRNKRKKPRKPKRQNLKAGFAKLVARSLTEGRKPNTLYVVCGADYYDFNKWWMEPALHCKKTLNGIVRQAAQSYCMKNRTVKIFEIDLSKVKPIYEGLVP